MTLAGSRYSRTHSQASYTPKCPPGFPYLGEEGLQGSSKLPPDFITLGNSCVNFLSLTFLSHANENT